MSVDRSRTDLVTLTLRLGGSTEHAVLVAAAGSASCWLPLSLIAIEGDDGTPRWVRRHSGEDIRVTLAEALAREKRLIERQDPRQAEMFR